MLMSKTFVSTNSVYLHVLKKDCKGNTKWQLGVLSENSEFHLNAKLKILEGL